MDNNRDAILLPYLPSEKCLQHINFWLENTNVEIKVNKARKTKLGDYRHIAGAKLQRITINNNLSPELFFFTLTHEIAHLLAYKIFSKRRIKPHGKEWKHIFGRMLKDSHQEYSEEIQEEIIRFARNPKSGYYGDSSLVRYFQKNEEEDRLLLEDLKEGMYFNHNNTAYKILGKNRTRYICKNLTNNKNYLVHKMVKVEKLEDEKIQ